ncbi:hypothetical protein B0H66DRAFT_491431 [Apodospora peruviana]|uniref:Uncharacterized protein n=1 Tax=Apodospora peruviana TaxID=516989 RepID=A0AAE0IGR9_9PEZI|nr:hypothetical protein B0H66DRAFT_491431 [Apodospora peruviana]
MHDLDQLLQTDQGSNPMASSCYIPSGLFQWQHYAVDEMFVVILPNGPVRVGDTVYWYTQWTVDSKGNKHQTFFSKMHVEKVDKAENGDDTIQLAHSYYTWSIQAPSDYQTITVHMANPGGYQSAMPVERFYQSPVGFPVVDAARVWTGKTDSNSPKKMVPDMPFIVIMPNGFGVDKPIHVLYQTASTTTGKNCTIRLSSVQKANTSSDGELMVDFFTRSDESDKTTCFYNQKTDKLIVRLNAGEKDSMDVSPLDLAALIEYHSDLDFNPPEHSAGKVEFDVRYPQAEPALARTHGPMPFPRTLVHVLTHTAAFLDEAGYMAKYAVDAYHALDKSYHATLAQVNDLNRRVRNLDAQVHELTTAGETEKKDIEALKKQLAASLDAAAKKESELTQQVHDLQKTVAKDKDHDAEDEKALAVAHEQIQTEKDARCKAEKQVLALQFSLSESQKRISGLQAKVAELTSEGSELRSELDVEKTRCAELEKRAGDLTAKVAVLEADSAAIKKALARTTEDLKTAEADSVAKDKVIVDLKSQVATVTRDRDIKVFAYKDLKANTANTISDLEDQVATLTAQIQYGSS